jgi:hypothetical protein
MGSHGNQDKPADTGRGGSSSTDGSQPSRHGSEGVPPQSGDGQGGSQ